MEKVAQYLCYMALQKNVEGVVNCCSGKPISVRRLVENYISKRDANISLNLGFYPYPEYEPMAFWGSTKKLQTLLNINNW